MKIGELANSAGVHIQTIRYYERRGLLPEPERRPSGYREYGRETLDRLHFIKHALVHLAGHCRGGRSPIGDCPLLDALGHIDTVRHTASGGTR